MIKYRTLFCNRLVTKSLRRDSDTKENNNILLISSYLVYQKIILSAYEIENF